MISIKTLRECIELTREMGKPPLYDLDIALDLTHDMFKAGLIDLYTYNRAVDYVVELLEEN